MFQAVSRRPVMSEARVRSQYSPYEICGRQSDTRRGCSPSISVPPVSIIPPILHTYLHLHAAVTRMTNGRSLGTLQKAMKFRKSDSIVWKMTSTFLFISTKLLPTLRHTEVRVIQLNISQEFVTRLSICNAVQSGPPNPWLAVNMVSAGRLEIKKKPF